MGGELAEKVKRGLDSGKSIEEVKSELVSQGFLEENILQELHEASGEQRTSEEKRHARVFTFKEVFDRVGYGFSSIQFVNILFYIIGANFFLVGVVNGLKTIISLIFSSFFQEYAKVKRVSIGFLSKSGILFGFSFIVIAMAITVRSVPLFAAALLVGAVGVVTYGDLYERLAQDYLKREKLGKFLLNISHFGVIITGLAMVLSGVLFDRFPMLSAHKILLFGKTLPIYGYLICFEVTAIAFILSGYVLHFVNEKKDDQPKPRGFFRDYWLRLKEQNRQFYRNRYLVLLLLAGSVTGLVQILGNSYYGIYIYQKFEQGTFYGIFDGIFLNLSFIFLFAIVFSFLGPAFSNFLNRRVGLAPSLVFGSLLLAIMPLVAAFNPGFLPLLIANSMSVVGSAILGMGQGLLVRKLIRDEHRHLYYAAMGVGVILPFIFLIPAGAWVAQTFGLVTLFQILAGILVCVVAPVYFILVLMANKQRL